MTRYVDVFGPTAKPLRLGDTLRIKSSGDTGRITRFRNGGPIQLIEIKTGAAGERLELPPAFFECQKKSEISLNFERFMKQIINFF
jgi:hypothetical protein